jgi:hypothetical protein
VEAATLPIDDRKALKDFLVRLRALLDYLADDPEGLFRPELRPLVSAAWKEVVETRRFEELESAIESGEYDQNMVEHGLQGAQLEFKIATFDSYLGDVQVARAKRFFNGVRLRQAVPEALQGANVIVDSVAAFVPPVGLIKEFKMGVEAAVAKRGFFGDVIRGLLPRRRARREVPGFVELP